MKVANPEGREYYLQRSKDNRMAQWCSKAQPARIEIDGTRVDAYGNPEKSDWIYLRFEGTAYCLWAKDPRDFEFLEETSLRITDRGRARSKAKKNESSQPRSTGKSPKFQMGKEDEPPTREDLDAVLRHLPLLRQQAAARAADADAAEGLYPAQYSSAVRKVVDAFFQHRFMFPFNYQPWMDEAQKLQDNTELLATADLETLRKLVVVHWRQDYWDYDHTHWESIAANGHLVALLDRLQEIAETMEPQTPTSDRDEPNTADSNDEEDEDDASTFVTPGVERYVAALEAIRERLTEQQIRMLQAHYHSGGRAATMRELATAAGYGDYKVANLQYGSLAKRLLKEMGLAAPRYGDGTIWLLGIAKLVDRSEFGLEWHFVMRQEVALALEEIDLVEKKEDRWTAYNGEVIDTAGDGSEVISDFIVYHNPDAMGPLRPGDNFGVVTNRGLGSATIGDRVWLITGEGTPRKYFLASWFYIEEFSSGEDHRFKHAIVGKNGRNFDPFAEIEQDEWFDQLKQDQGNFAFGFSRINTPGAVEGLKQIAGFNDRYFYIPNPAGKVDRIDETTARAIDKIVRWIPAIERADGQSAENDLDATLGGLLSDLNAADLSLKDPDGTWLTYAFAYATGHTELPKGDLQALRAAITWHTAGSRDMEYWREIAMNGQLLTLLRGFEDLLNFHEQRGLVTDPERHDPIDE